MANLYLTDDLEGFEAGSTVEITGSEARHAVTVARLLAGDPVTIGDGAGRMATGVVTAVDRTSFAVVLESVTRVPRSTPAVWLVQALAKGDRDELAIQAATELGVDGVIPWAAGRSISRWEGAKLAKGHERWTSVVREASKQSVRAWVPEVGPLMTTRQLAVLTGSTRMLVLEPTGSAALTALEFVADDTRDLVLLVGPEGGIAPNELDMVAAAGATLVRLGTTVLRTSTAGPAAIAVLSAKLGRW